MKLIRNTAQDQCYQWDFWILKRFVDEKLRKIQPVAVVFCHIFEIFSPFLVNFCQYFLKCSCFSSLKVLTSKMKSSPFVPTLNLLVGQKQSKNLLHCWQNPRFHVKFKFHVKIPRKIQLKIQLCCKKQDPVEKYLENT